MSATLARDHRRDVRTLTDLALADLARVWAQFDTADAARDGLLDLLPGLVALYGSAAATLSADFYDDLRDQAEVKGLFRAIPAELPDQGRTDSLARWGVAPLFQAEPDFTSALTLVSGGFQRIIANADRQTVAGSSIADPKARGWRRVGTGPSCGFCQMLLGRGAVYTEATSHFEAHDHCNCGAEPAFD